MSEYALGRTSAGVEYVLVPVADFANLVDLAVQVEDLAEVEAQAVARAVATCNKHLLEGA